jgi:hypothetical protein
MKEHWKDPAVSKERRAVPADHYTPRRQLWKQAWNTLSWRDSNSIKRSYRVYQIRSGFEFHDVGTENKFPQAPLERKVVCGGEDRESGAHHRHG